MFNPDPTYLYVPSSTSSRFNPSYVGELEISVTQPLLRGAGRHVNGVPIQITRIETEQSAWEFKKAVMASVRSIAAAYWDLHASHVAIRSIDEVIPLLEEVVRLQEESYKAEWVIYADVAKAQAQLHEFRQRRLALQSSLIENELTLRNLLRLPPADGWSIIPTDDPYAAREIVDAEQAVADAMSYQPDLVRQRLETRIRELELVVARNGLQPNLDFQALYRLNGVGERLDGALRQMYSAEYADWLVGFTFSVPLGNRQASANAQSAELQLARANGLLHQEALGIVHRVSNDIRQIDFAFQEYEQANKRLRAASDWLQGSRLRYQNPQPESGPNWLLQSLNDYLAALRFRTEAATDAAAVLAQYNTALVELEETKGTLLESLNIDLAADPCRQAEWLPEPVAVPDVPRTPPEFMPTPAPTPQGAMPWNIPGSTTPLLRQETFVSPSMIPTTARNPSGLTPSSLRSAPTTRRSSPFAAPTMLGR
jgi:outer membrane protein TolC